MEPANAVIDLLVELVEDRKELEVVRKRHLGLVSAKSTLPLRVGRMITHCKLFGQENLLLLHLVLGVLRRAFPVEEEPIVRVIDDHLVLDGDEDAAVELMSVLVYVLVMHHFELLSLQM